MHSEKSLIERKKEKIMEKICPLPPVMQDFPGEERVLRSTYVWREGAEQEALEATKIALFVTPGILYPEKKKGSGSERLHLFKVYSAVLDKNVPEEYKKRNLVPVDVYAFAALNKAEPTFCLSYPNGTIWKDDLGDHRSYALCSPFLGVPDIHVHDVSEHGYQWPSGTWFIGTEK